MDGDKKVQGAANDNAHSENISERSVEEERRTRGGHLDRVVRDIARLIGRQMARADYAARVAANDNGDKPASRDPEAE